MILKYIFPSTHELFNPRHGHDHIHHDWSSTKSISNCKSSLLIPSLIFLLTMTKLTPIDSISTQPSSSSSQSSSSNTISTSTTTKLITSRLPFYHPEQHNNYLLPKDILYHEPTKKDLQTLRDHYQQQQQQQYQYQRRIELKPNDNDDDNTGTSTSTKTMSKVELEMKTKNEKLNKKAMDEAIQSLENQKVCNQHGITLTLVGYKGRGFIQDQINQDRAFIHSPLVLVSEDNNNKKEKKGENDGDNGEEKEEGKEDHVAMQLMGVMDGHGHMGEHVSEYCVATMPTLVKQGILQLQRKQKQQQQDKNNKQKIITSENDEHDDHDEKYEYETRTNEQNNSTESIQIMLNDIFLAINATIPTYNNGGCTASVLFRYDNQVFVANVGDSRTFLFMCHYNDDDDDNNNVNNDQSQITKSLMNGTDNNDDENKNDKNNKSNNDNDKSHVINKTTKRKKISNVKLIYQSREDKPHLKEEKERIEQYGGIVTIPPKAQMESGYDTSRVVANQQTLAMSRSLGDWTFSNFGVIAKPIVDVIDLDDIITSSSSSSSVSLDSLNSISTKLSCDDEEKIKIFAVSATDGLLDYVKPKDLGEVLSKALYEVNDDCDDINCSYHTSSAVEELILRAARGWYNDMGTSYRDDIAIAAMKII